MFGNLQGIRLIYLSARLGGGRWLGPGPWAGGRDYRLIPGAAALGDEAGDWTPCGPEVIQSLVAKGQGMSKWSGCDSLYRAYKMYMLD